MMSKRTKIVLAVVLFAAVAVLLFGGTSELNKLETGDGTLVSVVQIGLAHVLAALIAMTGLAIHRWGRKK